MKKTVKDFIPFFAAIAASVITFIIYVATGGNDGLKILEAFAPPLCALIIPVINRIFKIRVPSALNVIVAVFAFVSVDLASVLDFYHIIPWFDKFLHTAFGTVGAFGVFVILLYGQGEKMKPWCFFVIIFFIVLGIAGAWEIYEYTANSILHTDIQRWMPDMSVSGNLTVKEFFKTYDPLWDTMWDMITAALGTFIFYLAIFIDKLCGYKLCKSIYKQVNFKMPKDD